MDVRRTQEQSFDSAPRACSPRSTPRRRRVAPSRRTKRRRRKYPPMGIGTARLRGESRIAGTSADFRGGSGGKLGPRVHTSVACRAVRVALSDGFIPSRGPNAHRAVSCHPSRYPSPSVSIAMPSRIGTRVHWSMHLACSSVGRPWFSLPHSARIASVRFCHE
jgi:hypothetical protein